MAIHIRRRELILALGGAAAWPLAAHAQQYDRMRQVGILMSVTRDPATEHRITTFQGELQKLGWTNGGNVQVDVRWGGGDLDRIRKCAAELVALRSDTILANGSVPVQELRRATRAVPIVFVGVGDPVGQGFVESLARPGGNVTGFTLFEFSICGKWVELLKQIAPRVVRIAVLRDPTDGGAGIAQYGVIQATAQSVGLELSPINTSDAAEIERGVAAFAAARDRGLIVTTSQSSTIHRDLIVTLAVRHRLPAVYPFRFFSASGGLVSYGPDLVDQYRRAAGYVDRILRGEKPADLPVQAPTKYELVVNLKTAKALGIEIPPTVLAAADEAIE